MTTKSTTTRILLLCNAEHGQANIFLAVAHELLRRGDVELHICSFPVLKKRVEKQLLDHVDTYGHAANERTHFHDLKGPTVTEVFLRCGKRGPVHAPGLTGCIEGLSNVFEDYWGWEEDEYVTAYQSCSDVLNRVDPDLVVIDYFFLPGRDAVYNQKKKYCLMNTTSLSHIVLGMQPNQAWIWKYPMVGTGYPYPLPPHLVPANALAAVQCTRTYRSSKQRRLLRKWRVDNDIKGRFPFADSWKPDRFHLSPCLPELDWPLTIPRNVIGCGPILLPARSVHEQDPELEQWLKQGPTVLLNLGTLFAVEAADARNLAMAIKSVLERASQQNLQVLWKLQKHPEDTADVYDDAIAPLKELKESGRVRVTSWLNAEPLALLESGHIVCSIHHGGANSWFEAIKTGVPHVVLPAWQDCYENAARAEWLGVGVYGNKSSAPHISTNELVKAIIAVVETDSFTRKARSLSDRLCKTEGRAEAASRIMDIATGKMKPEDYLVGDAPAADSKELSGLTEIRNKKGQVLTLGEKVEPSQSIIYQLIQDFFIGMHTAALWWMPLIAIVLLFVPWVRFPWLMWNLYSYWAGRHEEKSTFPFYYYLARRNPLFNTYRDFYSSYYPVRLYRTAPLPPTRKYVMGYHPHGIGIRGMAICFGMQATGFARLFPGLKTTFHVTGAAFKVPLWRSHLQLMGCKSVSRESCVAQLTSSGHDGCGMGNAIVISIGGAREAALARPNSMDIVVKIRKGFVRVAVETGADIVPVMGFGENDIWDRPEPDGSIRERMLKFLCRFTPETKLHKGRWSVVLPHRKPIHVVVGAPIAVEQQATPDPDYVDKLQGRYIQELEQIWNDWRDRFEVEHNVEFVVVE